MNDVKKRARVPHAGSRMCMPEAVRHVARRRLAIAKGHLESILQALQQHDVYCVDVLRQIRAVEGALQKAGQITLESHLRAHVATAAKRGDTEMIVEELMDALRYR
jgi:CsoR family transcriptional regulator, copper-sensing transcriptional repressor